MNAVSIIAALLLVGGIIALLAWLWMALNDPRYGGFGGG